MQYEDLVDDLEGTARRILGHCDLDPGFPSWTTRYRLRPVGQSEGAPSYRKAVLSRWASAQAWSPHPLELGDLIWKWPAFGACLECK